MTVLELFGHFNRWNEIHRATRTSEFYRECMAPLLKVHGGTPADQLRPVHLMDYRPTWHRIMAVQRMYAWGMATSLVQDNPFRKMPRPPRLGRLLLRLGGGQRGQGVIFRTCRGLPWRPNNVRCRMRRLREITPIELMARGERVVMYTLRHSTATSWASEGLPHAVIQELLGHTSPRMTQRYLHLGRRHMLDAWRRYHARLHHDA